MKLIIIVIAIIFAISFFKVGAAKNTKKAFMEEDSDRDLTFLDDEQEDIEEIDNQDFDVASKPLPSISHSSGYEEGKTIYETNTVSNSLLREELEYKPMEFEMTSQFDKRYDELMNSQNKTTETEELLKEDNSHKTEYVLDEFDLGKAVVYSSILEPKFSKY